MFVLTTTAAATATPLLAAAVVPDRIASFQSLIVVASGAAYLGDAAVSATNGIPLSTIPLVIPANMLQYASDLSEFYVIGAGIRVTVMVFG